MAVAQTKQTCTFKLRNTADFTCPHPAWAKSLCVFHFLSVREGMPDIENWKVASPNEDGIRTEFLGLLQSTESDSSCSVADFRGFCLPSLDLRGRTFTKDVLFNEAHFYGSVVFIETTFEKPANFSNAVFAGSADFYSMGFEDSVSFSQVRFEGDVEFVDGVCNGSAEFAQSTVSGRLQFLNWRFEGECSFEYVRCAKTGTILLEHVNLDNATFLGTQLELIEFRAVTWLSSGTRRKMLRDELPGALRGAGGRSIDPNNHAIEDEDEVDYFHEQLAANYRQLVLNYEKMRDFETAEEFHFCEMEMRSVIAERRYRNAFRKWIWRHFGPYRLYRVFSGYGASWGRAFCWLLVWILLVFPAAFMVAGFQQVDPIGSKPTRVIRYTLAPSLANTRQWIADYGKAVSFGLSAATFQRVRLYEPLGPWSYFLMIVGSVIFTSQTALLLLALRRRFKR
jgi:Pentapeptide repeats (9 copies)